MRSQYLRQFIFSAGKFCLLFVAWFALVPAAHAVAFDQNRLIDDVEFTNVGSMSVDDVQRFLIQQGSFLAQYSENGRSAAQIIVDASLGFGDASGTINGISISPVTGTVSPAILLTLLQKEQSLISMTSQNDAALRTAMGYSCPDSGGCNPAYAGFTKQVENAAWQLRYNYARAQGTGFSDYQVGQTACFSNPSGGTDCPTFANRATAALYRYTPHVYNGNYNFWNLYTNVYRFTIPDFAASWVGQNSYPTVANGQTTTMTISYRNTGSNTWTRGVVNLGTVNSDYSWKIGGYQLASNWLSPNRPAGLDQATVAPGEIGSFTFQITNPALSAGNYRLDVGLVADGIKWLPINTHAYWDVFAQ